MTLQAPHDTCREKRGKLIGAYDRQEPWRKDGATSMAAWSVAFAGVSFATGSEPVRVGRALEDLHLVSAALAEAELSHEQVRALTKVATPENEADLVEHAVGLTVAHTWALVRRLRTVTPREATDAHRRRYLRRRSDSDRSELRLAGRLHGAEGQTVVAALEPIAQAPAEPVSQTFEPWERRCADALVELAGLRLGRDADSDLATFVPHADLETSMAGDGPVEVSNGPDVAVETARQPACHDRVELAVDTTGGPIGVGRASLAVSAWLHRQVERRDQGCRWPGCVRTSWTHVRHLIDSANGGPTTLCNLAMLCGDATVSFTRATGGSTVAPQETFGSPTTTGRP